MPYDRLSDLPEYVKTLAPKRQRQWRAIWNQTYASCMAGAEPDSGNCESKAFSVASGVVIRQKGKAKHSMGRKQKTAGAASFKKLSYQARKKMPKGKFLYVDPSGKGHLPVNDAAHIRNALSRLGQGKTGKGWMGGRRAQLRARAQRMLQRASHNQGPPISPHADLAMDVATFKLRKGGPVRMTDDVVYRPATIFRAGNYPDKDFDLTPSELKAAAAKFGSPINVDYEHIDGPLDGHMGQLVAVQPSADGTQLHGMLAVPRWLHTVLPKAKLSATWDRASKTLVGLALVRNPRVPDAALFAAFSADQVARGEKPLLQFFKDLDADKETIGDEASAHSPGFLKSAAKVSKKLKKQEAKKTKTSMSRFNGDDDGDDDDDDDNGNGNGDNNGNGDGKNPFVKIAKKRNKANAKTSKKKAGFAGYDGMVPAGGWESQSGGARDGVSSLADIGKKGRRFALGKGPYGKDKRGTGAMAQAIHDISVSRGAVCRVDPEPATGAPGPYGIVRFDKAGKLRINNKKLAAFQGGGKAMQGIHDVSTAMGAKCAPTLYGQTDLAGGGPWQWTWPGVKNEGYHEVVRGGMTAPHFSKGDKRASMGKKKRALFNSMLASLDSTTGATTPGVNAYAGKKAKPPVAPNALAERNAQLEEENRQMRVQGIYDRAVAFADKALTEGHILPAQREWALAQHMQAAHDDWRVGTVAFAEGKSRVSQFEEGILGISPHNADFEAMTQNMREAAAVFNRMRTATVPGAGSAPGVESGAPMAPERRAYLLNLASGETMTGRNLARPAPNSTNGTAK